VAGRSAVGRLCAWARGAPAARALNGLGHGATWRLLVAAACVAALAGAVMAQPPGPPPGGEGRPGPAPVPGDVIPLELQHPCMFLNAAEIEAARDKVRNDPVFRDMYDALVADADLLRRREPHPVPGPFSHSIEGPLNADGTDDGPTDTARAETDFSAARNLAIVYALSGDEAYADKVVEIASSWVARMEPEWPKTRLAAFELARHLPALMYAVDLCWGSAYASADFREEFKAWIRPMAEGARRRHLNSLPTQTATNLCFIAAAGVTLEDRSFLDFAYNSADNIDCFQGYFRGSKDTNTGDKMPALFSGSGEAYYESKSADPIGGAMELLRAMICVAEIARHQGVDLYPFQHKGCGLEQALLFYAPGFDGTKDNPLARSPFRGSTSEAAIYEIGYARYGRPEFAAVLRRQGRELVDAVTLGPVALTHGVAALATSDPAG
jgi:hypothetical protein